MHKQKIPKSQKPSDKSWILLSGTLPTSFPLNIVSIDPGEKLPGVHVSSFSADGNLRTKIWEAPDIYTAESQNVDPIFNSIDTYLDNNFVHFADVNLVVVEQQPPLNFRMVRIMQAFIDYFRHKFPKVAVIEINTKAKRRWMSLKADESKEWIKLNAVLNTAKISYLRGDYDVFRIVQQFLHVYSTSEIKLAKIFDMCDAYVQRETTLFELSLISDLRNFFGNVAWESLNIVLKR